MGVSGFAFAVACPVVVHGILHINRYRIPSSNSWMSMFHKTNAVNVFSFLFSTMPDRYCTIVY